MNYIIFLDVVHCTVLYNSRAKHFDDNDSKYSNNMFSKYDINQSFQNTTL